MSTPSQSKKKMPIWKKVIFALVSLFVLLLIWVIIFPPNYYKMGNSYLGRNDYKNAYYSYGKVKKEDSNYNAATAKLRQLKPIIDSLERSTNIEEKRQLPNEERKVDQNSTDKTTITKQELSFIPGIAAVDVYENLTNKGFELTKEIGAEGCFYYCNKVAPEGTYYVRIFGHGANRIEEIQAIYTNYTGGNTNSLAKDFLGLIATIPYENSSPQKAKEWVTSNIKINANAEFAGVKFEIYANKLKIRTLRIHIGD